MIKLTIAFLVVLFVIVIASIFYDFSKTKTGAPAENNLDNGLGESENQSRGSSGNGSNGGELGTISPLSKNGSVGGSGGDSGDGSSGSEPEEKQLPPDLYIAPCGIYFAAYGVCNGTCAEGICTQEGRSCYCKRV